MSGSALHSFTERNRHGKLARYGLSVAIGVVIGCLTVSLLRPEASFAVPEADLAAAEGVIAVPAQLSADIYGLYLIDTHNETILLYSYVGPWERGLRLLSARSFRYDRRLSEFNTSKPSPQEVRKLLESDSTDSPEQGESGKKVKAGDTAEPLGE